MAPLLPRPSPERQEPANVPMPMDHQIQAPNAGEGMGYDNWQEDWMRAEMAFNQTADMAAAHSMTALNGTWGGMAQAFQNPFAMAYDMGPTGDANQAFDMQQCDFEATSPMSAPQPRRFTTGVLRQYDQALFPHLTARDSVRPSIEHDGRQPLQYGNTGPGQPDYGHRSSEDNAAQYTSPPNNKVALPPLSQQQPLPPQPASLAPAMGPLSSQVIVPARPKPGRKPLPQEDAVDRRRVQNRMAQRNFRDKRAQRVSELTVDNDRLRREMEAMTRKHENQLENQRQENNSLKRKVSDLEKDLDAAVKRAEDAENKLHSVDSLKRFKEAGFPNPVLQTTTTSAALPSIATNWRGPASSYTQSDNPSIMTPPDEGWPETDMTNFWTSRNADRNQPKPNEDNNTQWLGSGMDIDRDDNDGCGFCTDESNCSCLQSKKAEPVAIAPGGCDACIRDPARAEACRALAAKTEFSPLPTGGSEQRNDSMAPPPPPPGSTRLMSCSKFIDRVETQGPGLRVPSISELFGGLARQTIHSYPSSSGAGAGYDVNEQEAAQVLQSMSRRPSSARLQGRDAAPAQVQAP